METDQVEYRDNQSLYVFSNIKKESAFAGSVFIGSFLVSSSVTYINVE